MSTSYRGSVECNELTSFLLRQNEQALQGSVHDGRQSSLLYALSSSEICSTSSLLACVC